MSESPLWILLNSPLVTQLGVSALAIGAAVSAARIIAVRAPLFFIDLRRSLVERASEAPMRCAR